MPIFWTLKVQRHGIDMKAVNRQAGMEMMMNGHVPLAQILGPNEDMTKPLSVEVKLTACDNCAYDHRTMNLAEVVESKIEELKGSKSCESQ